MKSYFAYIRVSTIKQGEHGSSLQEQRDAITSFAARNSFHIVAWFEERETAAKVGRAEFSRMLLALRKGTASGVIFHKIDRSARNLKDWSSIQDLAELGVDVRFSQESISLESNEGKLTGDFLAVISSHYIRNLREEVKKGIRGRLKQGIYPLGAPIGYLNQGGGKAKIPDPARAPFIRDTFELYASGRFSLRSLSDELCRRGFRSKSGKKLEANRLAKLLRNPFYIGIIRMKRSGETYAGVHEPIVSKSLFDRVQGTLDGKTNTTVIVHDFLFRRTIVCANCQYCLIGERQKGNIYYRCHTRGCPTRCIREDKIHIAIQAQLTPLHLTTEEVTELHDMAASLATNWEHRREGHIKAIRLQLDAVSNRLAKLMDLYLEGAVERPLFEEKKLSLLMERKSIEEQHQNLVSDKQLLAQDMHQYLERVKTLPLSYESGNPIEKRELLKTITSNLCVDGKNVVVKLKSPFREIVQLGLVATCGLDRSRPRTRAKAIFEIITQFCGAQAEERQRDQVPPLAA